MEQKMNKQKDSELSALKEKYEKNHSGFEKTGLK